MKKHTCKRPTTCCCSIQGLEPSDDCPIHGSGEWPPHCAECGRLMKWPKRIQRTAEELAAIDAELGLVAYNPQGIDEDEHDDAGNRDE